MQSVQYSAFILLAQIGDSKRSVNVRLSAQAKLYQTHGCASDYLLVLDALG